MAMPKPKFPDYGADVDFDTPFPLKVLENIVRNHGLVAVQTHLDDTDYNDAIEAIAAARSRPWEPHLDYAGEPMQPGEFRDPPPQVSA